MSGCTFLDELILQIWAPEMDILNISCIFASPGHTWLLASCGVKSRQEVRWECPALISQHSAGIFPKFETILSSSLDSLDFFNTLRNDSDGAEAILLLFIQILQRSYSELMMERRQGEGDDFKSWDKSQIATSSCLTAIQT